MAEYIERENAYKLINEHKEKETGMYTKGKNRGLLIAKSIIHDRGQCPTEDVVKVVRCKDCLYSRPLCHTEKKLYNDDCIGCTKISTSYHSVIMSETDFCSYGELKEYKDNA